MESVYDGRGSWSSESNYQRDANGVYRPVSSRRSSHSSYESRDTSSLTYDINASSDEERFNSFEDIDKLIEKLEKPLPKELQNPTEPLSEKVREALQERNAKLAELKRLSAEAKERKMRENRELDILAGLRMNNQDLDEAIACLKKGFRN